jgi:hypothetical protein
MRPIRSQLLRHSGRNARRRIAAWRAGVSLLPFLMAPHAFAQNAAQQAALARLGLSRTQTHPQNAQPGGVEATTVPLVTPLQLAFDSAGNLYIADSGDHLIREVDLTGIISTVAGSGQEGFSGDGGPAIQAQLDTPSGVAVDAKWQPLHCRHQQQPYPRSERRSHPYDRG